MCKSIAEYTERIQSLPRRVSGRGIEGKWHLKLRGLYRERARLYEAQGRYGLAISDYGCVIATYIPARSDYWMELVQDYFRRARAHRFNGSTAGAVSDYTEIIALFHRLVLACSRPMVAGYYKLRAETHAEAGDHEKAISDLMEAIRLDPKDICSVSPDGCAMIVTGSAFAEAGGKRQRATTMLAALYAKIGDFDQARQVQRRALVLPDLSEEEATDARASLAVYDELANSSEH